MLVLSRKAGERILINGEIEVTLVGHTNGRVKLGIDAPDGVRIVRGELIEKDRQTELARSGMTCTEAV